MATIDALTTNTTTQDASTTNGDSAISADEVALYDRQIRLWGMEAQSRMRSSHILLLGMTGLSAETAKNLVLAGIGSLTIHDTNPVLPTDLSSNFAITESDIGRNRAEASAPAIHNLNPRVVVTTNTTPLSSLPADFYKSFSVVIVTGQPLSVLKDINRKTRAANVPFYAAEAYGLYGYVFSDLIVHRFLIERVKGNVSTRLGPESKTRSIVEVRTKREGGVVREFVTKEERYAPLEEVVAAKVDGSWKGRKRRTVPLVLPGVKAGWRFRDEHEGRLPEWEDAAEFTRLCTEEVEALDLPKDMLSASFISTFLEQMGTELAPVTALLGGTVAQDVINLLGKREQPLQNFLVFDGDTNAAPILALYPEKEEEAEAEVNGGGRSDTVVLLD